MRLIADALRDEDWARLWDGGGENPYFGILALSERLIVTGESISMISEALAAGPPVHVLRLDGRGERHEAFLSRRHRRRTRFRRSAAMTSTGALRGKAAVNATDVPAARLRQMLGLD